MKSWKSPLFRDSEYEIAARYASTHWPILIQGETGVGKEFLARWLHAHSAVAQGPFFPINCSALPVHLIESELFGFERGAFTGAHTASPGLIRSADGGTLFLDEIAELDLGAQAKLLRFLDSGEVRPLSSRRFYSSRVRILAATHVDLPQAVRRGDFRLDLFERLSVFCLNIPPLRGRPECITEIAQNIAREHGIILDNAAAELLTPLPWPGNIRQLRNVLVRAAVLGNGVIRTDGMDKLLHSIEWTWMGGPSSGRRTSASEKTASSDSPWMSHAKLREIERDVVVTRLRQFGGNKRATARDLGIAKSTLHEMLRKWQSVDEPISHRVNQCHDSSAVACVR